MNCPLPTPPSRYDTVTLAHGGGGSVTGALLRDVFFPAFPPPTPSPCDAAPVPGAPGLVFTTDSHVVNPLFFPGGDIGRLAVSGTVNDLLASGARPNALSAGFILEEGLPVDTLRRVVASMKAAAEEAGVSIVTGDTKVVERTTPGFELFVNTAGVGTCLFSSPPAPERIAPGDVVLLTSDIARHGIAVMAERHGLAFSEPVASDAAPLSAPLLDLYADGAFPLHAARDPTRGGVAAVLCEIAAASGFDIEIDESAVPVLPPVRAACDLLGFDPLTVANEGSMLLFFPPEALPSALETLHRHPQTRLAAPIGRVLPTHTAAVSALTPLATRRRILPPSGTLLPRIC